MQSSFGLNGLFTGSKVLNVSFLPSHTHLSLFYSVYFLTATTTDANLVHHFEDDYLIIIIIILNRKQAPSPCNAPLAAKESPIAVLREQRKNLQ